MPDLADRQQLEIMLRRELEEAESRLKKAAPEQKQEAVKQYSQALKAFSELVVHGKEPKESRCA